MATRSRSGRTRSASRSARRPDPTLASVVEIWRYPVKSMAGERLDSCAITDGGLEGDRRWAFIDQSPARAGKWFNIKQHAPLMTYHARLVGGALDLVGPDGSSVALDEALVRRFETEAQ